MRRGLLVLVCAAFFVPGARGLALANPPARASLVLRVSPPVAMAPAKVTVFAELQGGSENDPEYYCPALEWEWDDGSVSERKQDCEPFEAGKTKITRRFIGQHEYKQGGYYEVTLRLKRGDKVLLSGTVNVQITGDAVTDGAARALVVLHSLDRSDTRP